MNESLRFPIAILVSLLLHIALLMWIVHLVKVPALHSQGSFQVFLRNGVHEQRTDLVQLPTSVTASSIKIPEATRKQPPAEVSGPSSSSGNSAAPQFRPADMMNSMQLAQTVARQRELSRAAVMAQMSDIAAQLRPLVSTSIICEQQKSGGIDCTPEPEGKLLPLLQQFSRVASEAHQLDITGNPARIDFGQGLGVSVKLTSP